jgi:hypothetical protein
MSSATIATGTQGLEKATSRKKNARIAGLVYLLFAIPGPFVLLYVPSKVIVLDNAAATAQNVLAHETLFRAGIVGEWVLNAAFLFVPLALYRLLKEVDKGGAVVMVILYLVSVPISFAGTAGWISALTVIRGANVLSAFDQPQREAVAYIFLRLHHWCVLGAQVFWGLWLFPFGWLVYKSRFLPRIIGIWLMLACWAYVADSVGEILWPAHVDAVSRITSPLQFAELAILLWLIIVGAKEESVPASVQTAT